MARIVWMKNGCEVYSENREWKAGDVVTVPIPSEAFDELRIRFAPEGGCTHERITIEKKQGFYSRRGCLDCNVWLDPVELDGTPTS